MYLGVRTFTLILILLIYWLLTGIAHLYLHERKKNNNTRGGVSYVVFGKLYLDGFGVSSGLPLLVEQLLGVAHPGQQLVQRMLELAQGQKASLQFVLD